MDSIFDALLVDTPNLKVRDLCYLTLPCIHYVKEGNSNEWHLEDGVKILNLLRKEGIVCEHFEEYKKSLNE